MKTEELLEHRLQGAQAEPVGDMLVHGPTLQAVRVAVKPLVLCGHKLLVTAQAPMNVRRALDQPSPHAGSCNYEVKHPPGTLPHALGRFLPRDNGQVFTLAEGALLAQDRDPLGDA